MSVLQYVPAPTLIGSPANKSDFTSYALIDLLRKRAKECNGCSGAAH